MCRLRKIYKYFLQRILIIGEELLWRVRYTDFENSAIERVKCQKTLSIFCGIWNNFQRHKRVILTKAESKTHNEEETRLKQYFNNLQEYDFQNPSNEEFKEMRRNVEKITRLIYYGKMKHPVRQ